MNWIILTLALTACTINCSAQASVTDTTEYIFYRNRIKTQTLFLDLNPENTSALLERSFYLQKIQDFSRSIEDLDRFIELRPDDYRAIAMRGVSKYYNRNSEGAIEDFTRTIAIGLESYEVYELRSNAYRKIGNEDKSAEDFKTGLKLKRKK